MKRRNALLSAAGIVALPFLAYFVRNASAAPKPTLYLHIKHEDPYPYTLGKVQQIYATIQTANTSGRTIGLEPQCNSDWETQKAYLSECGNIPVMLTVLSSDNFYSLTIPQIEEALALCNVQWLRVHEALSAYSTPEYPFPTAYTLSVLELAKQRGIPVFWNEWDVNRYPALAQLISGYEGNVAVSFGTNNNWLEPIEGYVLLQQFQRRAASVQSWYWWERNDRQSGYEYTMPTELMVQHTQEAFQAGCEIVQYEPFGYFFDAAVPKATLPAVLL